MAVETSLHPPSDAGARVNGDGRFTDGHYVRMEFPAVSANIGFARTAVAVFASRLDFTIDELDEIKLAVSEAVSNCVLHAYPSQGGWVRLETRVEDGSLHVVISDDGIGIADPTEARQAGVTSRPADCMGLGFTFMAEYMDSLHLVTEIGRGTRVTMRKTPQSPAAEEPSENDA